MNQLKIVRNRYIEDLKKSTLDAEVFDFHALARRTIAASSTAASRSPSGASPKREYDVGARDCGRAASSTPSNPSGSDLVIRPSGSSTADIPVLAARTSDRPSSIARTRACWKC